MMRQLAIVLLIGSLLGLTAAGALATGPPLVAPIQDEFTAENPCTGQLTTISLTGESRVHAFYNEAGDVHHWNITTLAEIQTSDGFQGMEVFVAVHNAEGPFAPTEEEERGMEVVLDRFVARNPATGQVVWARFTLHLTYVHGEFVVNTESFQAECRGVGT